MTLGKTRTRITGIHIYQGKCPDEVNGPYSRDPKCPVCAALILAESYEPEKENSTAESNKAPEEIYLQLDGDGGNEFIEDCATWAPERIYESDIKYVQAKITAMEVQKAT